MIHAAAAAEDLEPGALVCAPPVFGFLDASQGADLDAASERTECVGESVMAFTDFGLDLVALKVAL